MLIFLNDDIQIFIEGKILLRLDLMTLDITDSASGMHNDIPHVQHAFLKVNKLDIDYTKLMYTILTLPLIIKLSLIELLYTDLTHPHKLIISFK